MKQLGSSDINDSLEADAFAISEKVYALITELPEVESAGMCFRLRFKAMDLTSSVTEALASIYAPDAELSLSVARRALASIRQIYLLATKVDYIELDPDFMVIIDRSVKSIAHRMAEARTEIDRSVSEGIKT